MADVASSAGAGTYDASAALGGGSGGGGGDSSSALGAGALGAGAVGLGALLMSKPQLPWGYQVLQGRAGTMYGQSADLYGEGQQMVGDARRGYEMAQRGELTPEQDAQLKLMKAGELNKATQLMSSMGRDINKDTTGLSMQQDIDLKALAQSQVFIKSTIALATSQMQGGQSLIGDALAEQSEADKVLQAAADAQIKQDAAYSAAMGQAFKAIGTIAAIGVGTMVGGPAGGMLGATLAGAAFGSGGSK